MSDKICKQWIWFYALTYHTIGALCGAMVGMTACIVLKSVVWEEWSDMNLLMRKSCVVIFFTNYQLLIENL